MFVAALLKRHNLLLTLALLTLSGCRNESSSQQAELQPVPSARVFGLQPGEDVPEVCRTYAQKVLRCVAHERFPHDAREAQTSALQQMMQRMKLEGVTPSEHAAALRSAEEECDVSLNTLRISSRESCPGVF
jgi:hypothetical protein